MDCAVCLDVWEHVAQPEPVMRELLRVVRPGGRAFIEFYPWYSYCSSHLDGWIPVPWAHVLFSERALVRVAERIHDADFFQPAWWLKDEQGAKVPFPLAGKSPFNENWLNRLSERAYRHLLKKLSRERLLSVERYDLIGFSGTTYRFSILLRPFRKLPVLREFIGPPVFSVIISKPSARSDQ